MQTNYPLTLVALLLFILAGCTDANNPVGPDIDLRFTEDARSVSGESMEVAFDSADEYKRPGDMAVLVAEGKFSFSHVIKRAFSCLENRRFFCACKGTDNRFVAG